MLHKVIQQSSGKENMTTDIDLNMVNKQEFVNLHYTFLPLDGTKHYTLVLYFNLIQISFGESH